VNGDAAPTRWLPRRWRAALAVVALLGTQCAFAEPYLAAQQGYRCVQCHVNPTGGGLRNDFGTIFTKTLLAARVYPEGAPNWTGKVFGGLRVGGDVRASWQESQVPHQPTATRDGVDQARVYADLELFGGKVAAYVDEQLAPGDAQRQELYLRAGDPASGWYLKGGQFYLPFGWRLQDNTSFVRGVSGISMTTPDQGVELGFERAQWSAQFDVSKAGIDSGGRLGDRLGVQFVWVEGRWRLGGGASRVNADAGDRTMAAVFGSWRTGQFTWLGEADLIHDASFRPAARSLAALLGEVNWAFRRGHNLKLTGEYYDPDRAVANDAQARWSLLYEYTPFPFVQLRAGWRRYEGIAQSDFQNRRLGFVELHAFF
jgi:hypothetical protein